MPARMSQAAQLACALLGLVAATLHAQSYDLGIADVSAPGSGAVGTPLTVVIGISAPPGASGVTVTAIFQPAVVFNPGGSTAGCGANAAGGDPSTTVTCPATGLSTVSISVTPQQAVPLNVVAGVIGREPDPNLSNNSGRRTISVAPGSTPSPTPTATRTATPTSTPTPTPALPTPTPSRTPTPAPTATKTATPTATPIPPVNAATFVTQTVPTSVAAGAAFSATVTMKNTGTTTWTAAGYYRLGSLVAGNPWGSRVLLDGSSSIAPGQQRSFTVAAVAPQAAGMYSFQWQMVQDGVGWFGAATPVVQVTVTAAALMAYSIPPCRIVDTRRPTGPSGGPALSAGETRLFPMNGSCGVPSTARIVTINIAAVGPATAGFLVLYPANLPLPATSTVNFRTGAVRSNNAVVTLDSAGQMAVYAYLGSGTLHFIADVTGYLQ